MVLEAREYKKTLLRVESFRFHLKIDFCWKWCAYDKNNGNIYDLKTKNPKKDPKKDPQQRIPQKGSKFHTFIFFFVSVLPDQFSPEILIHQTQKNVSWIFK